MFVFISFFVLHSVYGTWYSPPHCVILFPLRFYSFFCLTFSVLYLGKPSMFHSHTNSVRFLSYIPCTSPNTALLYTLFPYIFRSIFISQSMYTIWWYTVEPSMLHTKSHTVRLLQFLSYVQCRISDGVLHAPFPSPFPCNVRLTFIQYTVWRGHGPHTITSTFFSTVRISYR